MGGPYKEERPVWRESGPFIAAGRPAKEPSVGTGGGKLELLTVLAGPARRN